MALTPSHVGMAMAGPVADVESAFDFVEPAVNMAVETEVSAVMSVQTALTGSVSVDPRC